LQSPKAGFELRLTLKAAAPQSGAAACFFHHPGLKNPIPDFFKTIGEGYLLYGMKPREWKSVDSINCLAGIDLGYLKF